MTRNWLAILALTAVVGGCAGAGTARVVAQRDAAATPPAVAAVATAGGATASAGGAATTGAAGGLAAARPGARGNATTGTVDKVGAGTLTVRTQAGTVDVPLNEQTTVM